MSIILPSKGNSWLYEFSKKCQILFSRAEFEMTAGGKRKVGTLHLDPSNFDMQLEQLTDRGIYFVPIFRSKKKDGFSHKLEIEDKIYKDTVVYGAISTNLDHAKEFKSLYKIYTSKEKLVNQFPDHKKIGDLLGYPSCCSSFFNENFKDNKDPIFKVARNSDQESKDFCYKIDNPIKENSIHLRYFGFRVIPWVPCSYYCAGSSTYAKQWINLMYELDHDTTERLLGILSTPGEFSLVNGQMLWKSDLFIGMCDALGDYYIEPRKITISNGE
jgi:hypothetical protein